MIKKRLKQFSFFMIAYIIIVVGFFYIGGTQIQYSELVSNLQKSKGVLPELVNGNTVEQEFYASSDSLDSISFMITTYGRDNRGDLELSLLEGADRKTVSTKIVPVNEFQDNSLYTWKLEPAITNAKSNLYVLRIESTCLLGEAPSLSYSDCEAGVSGMWVNSEQKSEQLTFQFSGKVYNWFGLHYWKIMGGLGVVILLYLGMSLYRENQGKCTFFVFIENIWKKYEFLIKQLVLRDFKTKYKRSVLGYLWSFLNPLLTMVVQYVVFSNIFKQNIKNFPVYLLAGTILFNFFQEAVGQGLNSILANASLISKVYMPKYIYPVTKVVSCSINLLISMIPLIIVTMITGSKITPAILLLPFVLMCLILFCIGFSLMLSSAMVFFRDTQYLWGIATLIWMYATPLFYPENIIPDKYQFIQKINPLYHMIKFTRIILIDGVSPEPRRYLYCFVSAAVMCVVGASIFKKCQDKFILYI